jgi:hypothetical protein
MKCWQLAWILVDMDLCSGGRPLVLCISQTVPALYWVVGPCWDDLANTVVTRVAIFHIVILIIQ